MQKCAVTMARMPSPTFGARVFLAMPDVKVPQEFQLRMARGQAGDVAGGFGQGTTDLPVIPQIPQVQMQQEQSDLFERMVQQVRY